MNKILFDKIKAVAFDLDGTIYFGNTLADKALEVIDFLRNKGIEVFFFTNNSSKTRVKIHEKLNKLEIKTDIEHVYNSAFASAHYLKNQGYKKVFCLGTDDLERELKAQGLDTTKENGKVDAILIGMDENFDYKKLATALNTYQKGCKLIAANIDKNYPVENGELRPGAGAIVAATEAACKKDVDYIIGKPNTYMMELLVKINNLSKEEILVIGDNKDSDIKMAEDYGLQSILISKKEFENIIVLKELKEILGYWGND